EKHTLEAVMTMPSDLFPGVHTAIVVFIAKQPHPKDYPTWFASWKDDGFRINKKVRVERRKGIWEREIMPKWRRMFRGKREEAGCSVRIEVTSEMEWCAGAYLTPASEAITIETVEAKLRDLALHCLKYDISLTQ